MFRIPVKKLPETAFSAGTIAAAMTAVFIVCGCDPFDNAENLFPLPPQMWDRACRSKQYKLFEINNISEVDFIRLKALLENNGYKQTNRDFYFSAAGNGSQMKVTASDGILLICRKFKDSMKYTAAIYLKHRKTLLLGIGTPEK